MSRKFNEVLARDIRLWLAKLLPQHQTILDGPESFGEVMKSGVILCELVNYFKPGTIFSKQICRDPNQRFRQRENVDSFLKGAKQLGVDDLYIFVTVDLYEEKNLSKVCDCILQIQKLHDVSVYQNSLKAASKAGTFITTANDHDIAIPEISVDTVVSPKPVRDQRSDISTLTQDEERKKLLKYTPELESACKSWIEALLGEKCSTDFQSWLKDGTVLCRMINKIKPGTISDKTIYSGPQEMRQRENVFIYLRSITKIGVASADLFDVSDLFEGKNMNMVLTHLNALANLCEGFEGWTGPQIANTSQAKNLLQDALFEGEVKINEDFVEKFTDEEKEIIDWANATLLKCPIPPAPIKNFESLRSGIKIIQILWLFQPHLETCEGLKHYKEPKTILNFFANASYILMNVALDVKASDMVSGSRDTLTTVLRFIRERDDYDFRFQHLMSGLDFIDINAYEYSFEDDIAMAFENLDDIMFLAEQGLLESADEPTTQAQEQPPVDIKKPIIEIDVPKTPKKPEPQQSLVETPKSNVETPKQNPEQVIEPEPKQPFEIPLDVFDTINSVEISGIPRTDSNPIITSSPPPESPTFPAVQKENSRPARRKASQSAPRELEPKTTSANRSLRDELIDPLGDGSVGAKKKRPTSSPRPLKPFPTDDSAAGKFATMVRKPPGTKSTRRSSIHIGDKKIFQEQMNQNQGMPLINEKKPSDSAPLLTRTPELKREASRKRASSRTLMVADKKSSSSKQSSEKTEDKEKKKVEGSADKADSPSVVRADGVGSEKVRKDSNAADKKKSDRRKSERSDRRRSKSPTSHPYVFDSITENDSPSLESIATEKVEKPSRSRKASQDKPPRVEPKKKVPVENSMDIALKKAEQTRIEKRRLQETQKGEEEQKVSASTATPPTTKTESSPTSTTKSPITQPTHTPPPITHRAPLRGATVRLTEEEKKKIVATKLTISHISKEILSTEKFFTEKISLLVKVFFEVVESENLLNEEEKESVFSNIKHIANFHENLYQNLKKLFPPVDAPILPDSVILDISHLFAETVPELWIYQKYLANYPTSNFSLGFYRTQYPKLDNLSKQIPPLLGGHAIADVLIMPIQRLPRYLMLLGSLQKYIPEGALNASLGKIQDDLQANLLAMNSNVDPERLVKLSASVEKQTQLVNWPSSIPKKLDRCLLIDERVKIKENKDPGKKGFSKKDAHIILFQDMMVIAAPNKKTLIKHLREEIEQLNYLDGGVVADISKEDAKQFRFRLVNNEFSWLVETNSPADCDKMISFIRDVLGTIG